jgi:predicted lactoylglutathione lyase
MLNTRTHLLPSSTDTLTNVKNAAVGRVATMDQRVSLITLGVADVAVSRAFYERLGWGVGLDVEETVFFQVGGLILGLWARDKLARDSCVTDSGGWGGITLAHNVASREEVHRVIDDARAAGARIGREPSETFYGGYAGVFIDLDGHPWEVAYNPGFKLSDDGSVRLPQS